MNFRIDFNEEDIRRITSGFAEAVAQQSSLTLEHLADMAVQSLYHLDYQLGHRALAELWTHSAVVPEEDGLQVIVFSEAEKMRFWNKTTSKDGDRVPSDVHFIEGEALLNILEGGAQAHTYGARLASRLLFPHSQTGQLVSPLQVKHPGVKANENMQQTAEIIMNELDAIGTEAAERISAELY
jgi:hypothetical protein